MFFLIVIVILILIGVILYIELSKSTNKPSTSSTSTNKPSTSSTSSTSTDKPSTSTIIYPSKDIYYTNPQKEWYWVDDCRTTTKFIIDSEWPTFLKFSAWDSCQGCKSGSGSTDSTLNSMQIIGDWMRISCLNGQDISIVSNAESKEHWFNPPRNNTTDKPLEIELYFYFDASVWGKTLDELVLSGISDNNWSAFWAFGHGVQIDKNNNVVTNPFQTTDIIKNYAWPNCGELDFIEWLPSFGVNGKGLASGVHNSRSGAYPPCCMKRSDEVSFPKKSRVNQITTDPSTDFTFPDQGGFNNWGYPILQKQNPKLLEKIENSVTDYNPSNKDTYILKMTDAITYNNIIHTFIRMTNTQCSIWAKINADPTNPPKLDIKSEFSNDDVDKILSKYNYVMVSNTFADYGSNNDTSYPFNTNVKGTNWHQNLFFVWSAILSQGNRRMNENEKDFWKSIVFYLSDIKIRGGGNYTKAVPPVDATTDFEKMAATIMTDPTSNEICKGLWGNNPQTCTNRLKSLYM